jgi:acyl-CoA reductase-like NAD-dependent aldehyde dehydrogenase
MVRDHQLNEAVFRSILPEDIDWKPFPAFPQSARLAVLVGEPAQAGPYLIRVKVPAGVKLMFGGTKKSGHGRTKGFAALHEIASLKTYIFTHN